MCQCLCIRGMLLHDRCYVIMDNIELVQAVPFVCLGDIQGDKVNKVTNSNKFNRRKFEASNYLVKYATINVYVFMLFLYCL